MCIYVTLSPRECSYIILHRHSSSNIRHVCMYRPEVRGPNALGKYPSP